MKLITEKGQMALPEDFSFEIEKSSPFFGGNGTASIPVTLPADPSTLGKLMHPQRPAMAAPFMRKVKAGIEAGVFQKQGVLVVDSIATTEGLSASLALDESEVYASFKDKKLSELFAGMIRDDFADSEDPIAAWADYLYKCAKGSESDDFVIGPVAVNKSGSKEEPVYNYLNDVHHDFLEPWWPLDYKSRVVNDGEDEILIPDGYGLTPFFFLHRFLVLLMKQIGYTLRANPFAQHAVLRRIILLNNTADTLCKGKINYADIVPTCTLDDFLSFLNNKFHAQAFIYPESSVADIVLFESLFNTPADWDLSPLLDSTAKLAFPDLKQISLEADTSLEDAKPAMENYQEFVKTYPVVKSITESEFKSDLNGDYAAVFRKVLGRYYYIKKNLKTEQITVNHLGTNNFNFSADSENTESIKAVDLSVGMVRYCPPESYKDIIAPYIGKSRHLNTSYNGKDDTGSEQKIILCYFPGTGIGYPFITNQKYDRNGELWTDFGLDYPDLYTSFWKRYNDLLRNGAPTISGKFDYSLEQLMTLRLDRLKLYRGQLALLKSLSYGIGSKVACRESSCLLCSAALNAPPYEPPRLTEQLYKWVREDNEKEIKRKYLDSSVVDIKIEYIETPEMPDVILYMPAPTTEGQIDYKKNYQIDVWVYYADRSKNFEDVLNTWYRSVPL